MTGDSLATGDGDGSDLESAAALQPLDVSHCMVITIVASLLPTAKTSACGVDHHRPFPRDIIGRRPIAVVL
jgi:hypothetical protein